MSTTDLINRAPVSTDMEVRRHELFADLAEQAATRLMQLTTLSMEDAADVGNTLADFLAELWCGQYVYITADTQFRHSSRDMEIYTRMGTRNAQGVVQTAALLARAHGISTVRVYQIYARMRRLINSRQQPDMFGDQNQMEGSNAN